MSKIVLMILILIGISPQVLAKPSKTLYDPNPNPNCNTTWTRAIKIRYSGDLGPYDVTHSTWFTYWGAEGESQYNFTHAEDVYTVDNWPTWSWRQLDFYDYNGHGARVLIEGYRSQVKYSKFHPISRWQKLDSQARNSVGRVISIKVIKRGFPEIWGCDEFDEETDDELTYFDDDGNNNCGNTNVRIQTPIPIGRARIRC